MRVITVLCLFLLVIIHKNIVGSSKKKIPALSVDFATSEVVIQGKHKTVVTKITIVDDDGQIVYETKVKPLYRRIRDPVFRDGEEFYEARRIVKYIINCRLLIGHDLKTFLHLLSIRHPLYLQRDTAFVYSSCVNRPDEKDFKRLAKRALDINVDKNDTRKKARAAMEIYKKYRKQWEKHTEEQHKTAFALDCEMIECERGRVKTEVVAKLSIVDHLGDVVYDKLFKPELPVSSYRTFVTGLRKDNFSEALYLSDELERLRSFLDGNIVVGHAVDKDLGLLRIHVPFVYVRDSSRFDKFCSYFPNKRTPSLRDLARTLLNMTIQSGHHDSVEDAHATMMLYLKYRTEWDEYINRISKVFVSD